MQGLTIGPIGIRSQVSNSTMVAMFVRPCLVLCLKGLISILYIVGIIQRSADSEHIKIRRFMRFRNRAAADGLTVKYGLLKKDHTPDPRLPRSRLKCVTDHPRFSYIIVLDT